MSSGKLHVFESSLDITLRTSSFLGKIIISVRLDGVLPEAFPVNAAVDRGSSTCYHPVSFIYWWSSIHCLKLNLFFCWWRHYPLFYFLPQSSLHKHHHRSWTLCRRCIFRHRSPPEAPTTMCLLLPKPFTFHPLWNITGSAYHCRLSGLICVSQIPFFL